VSTDSPVDIREDLRLAHRLALAHVAAPGATLDGARRRRIGEVAIGAYLDPGPQPPWVPVYGDPLLDAARRLARFADTLTEAVYAQALAEGVEAVEWVEMVGVVIAAVAPTAFAHAAGLPILDLPTPGDGPPTGLIASPLVSATLNWVPVAAPADQTASVVQALSAVPAEWDNLWRLAEAQYMSDAQMSDPLWNRGTLSRPQMELVAGRLSLVRRCFF